MGIRLFYLSLCHSLSSVQFSCSVVSDSLRPHEPQHARPPWPSPTTGVHPNPCPLCQWCHPAISSSVVPFSSGPYSFPASGSFQMSQLSACGGQSSGVSASTSVPPMNSQGWSLGWTGWISLQSKGLSRVFFFFFFFFLFFKFYFIFKLYNIVLVLPNIKMNLPQVYLCSPSWTLLPPPSPYPPSGSSQCTSPKHLVSCIEPGLVTHFIHDIQNHQFFGAQFSCLFIS